MRLVGGHPKVGEAATRLWRTVVTSKKDGGLSMSFAEGSQGQSMVVDGGGVNDCRGRWLGGGSDGGDA